MTYLLPNLGYRFNLKRFEKIVFVDVNIYALQMSERLSSLIQLQQKIVSISTQWSTFHLNLSTFRRRR